MAAKGNVGVWRVVGGTEAGGILVRHTSDLASPAQDQRLAKGSLLEGLELLRDRLRYKLLSGSGPATGWVSTQAKGRPLVERTGLDATPYNGAAAAALAPARLRPAAEAATPADSSWAASGAPAGGQPDIWAGLFPERPEPLTAGDSDAPSGAELAASCEARGFLPSDLESPDSAAGLLERLERAGKRGAQAAASELRARGFAEPPGELQEATSKMLQEVMVWELLRLSELRRVCKEKELPLEGCKTRQDFMKLLAKCSWEARGVPAWRFCSLIVAHGVLDVLDRLEGKSLGELAEQCEWRGLPVEEDSPDKCTLLKRLRTSYIWEHLSPSELQRECASLGLLPGDLEEGSGDPRGAYSNGLTQGQKTRLFERLYEHMWAQPGTRDSERLVGLLAKLQLPPGAGLAEVRKAYHALAKKLNPERNIHNAAKQFREATEAYEELVAILHRPVPAKPPGSAAPGRRPGEAENAELAVGGLAEEACQDAAAGPAAGQGQAAREEEEPERPEGLWLVDECRGFYEVRSDSSSAGGAPRLGFYQRVASGDMVWGPLHAAENADWGWEGELSNKAKIRLRLQGSAMASSYRFPEDAEWQPSQIAEKPRAYAWYDAYAHAKGYRYAHLLGETPIQFPIIGLTTGWLPAMVVDASTPKVGRLKVRFPGPFCDPYDALPQRSVGSSLSGSSKGQPGGLHLLGKGYTRPKALPDPLLGKGIPVFAGRGRGKEGKGGKGAMKGGPLGTATVFGRGGLLRGPAATGQKVPKQGLRPAEPSNPVEAAALEFGCPITQLYENALFRGKLRPLPKRKQHAELDVWLPAHLVRPAVREPPPKPLLSILCVRWFDYWSDPSESSDFWTLNDGFFQDLLHGPCSAGTHLPGDFEVCTVFVRSTRDLAQLNPSQLRAMLRGRNVVAWYFVWPSSDAPGFVSEREFFHFCQAAERVRLRSGWPHEMTLYRQLCGKLWIPQMSLNKDYKVPPTTRLHWAEFKRNPSKAVSRALEALLCLRRRVWGWPWESRADWRLVVKLGFSWGGSDVLPCRGPASVEENARQLFSRAGCQGRSEQTVCLVQELIPDVVGEHRVLCMYDQRKGQHRRESFWMVCNKPAEGRSHGGVGDFRMASSSVLPEADVLARFFGQDSVAMRRAEAEAQHLVDLWLRWFSTESPRPPQCTRIDFLVAHPGPGLAEVWTCEVGECGASLCSVEVHGRNASALNRAVLSDSSGKFPISFPDKIPRNNGWKS